MTLTVTIRSVSPDSSFGSGIDVRNDRLPEPVQAYGVGPVASQAG